MNVIVIDDQMDVVRGIVGGVDWKRLRVKHVYTATSFPEAQEVFDHHPVDIMLCDIEMPMGNGIEVLSWVRENYPGVECIFLTSHANFEYARAALALGSFEYILQPVKYAELEEVIADAIAKHVQEMQNRELSDYGSYWLSNRDLLLSTALKQILTDPQHQGRAGSLDLGRVRDGLGPDTVVFPALFTILRQHSLLENWDDDLQEYALHNILTEIIDRECELVRTGEGQYTAIIFPDSSRDSDDQAFQAPLIEFRNACESCIKCAMACYMGEFTPLTGLYEVHSRLLEAEKENVARYAKVFPPRYREAADPASPPPLRSTVWQDYINRGWYSLMAVEMEGYLQDLVQKQNIDAAFLHTFHKVFLKQFYLAADQLGIDAQDIFSSRREKELLASAGSSVEAMIEFIRYAASLFDRVGNKAAKEDSPKQNVVEQVVSYISENLGREISRNELADLVAWTVPFPF